MKKYINCGTFVAKAPCTESNNCQHVCYVNESTNTQACSCNRGYRIQSNGVSCIGETK